MSIDQQSGLFALTLDPAGDAVGARCSSASGTDDEEPWRRRSWRRGRRASSGRPDVVYQATVDPVDGSYQLVVSQSLTRRELRAARDADRHVAGAAEDDDACAPTPTRRSTSTFEAPLTLPELHGTILDSLAAAGAGHAGAGDDVPTTTAPAGAVDDDDDRRNGAFSIRLDARRCPTRCS